jgi:hypothetical protein
MIQHNLAWTQSQENISRNFLRQKRLLGKKPVGETRAVGFKLQYLVWVAELAIVAAPYQNLLAGYVSLRLTVAD